MGSQARKVVRRLGRTTRLEHWEAGRLPGATPEPMFQIVGAPHAGAKDRVQFVLNRAGAEGLKESIEEWLAETEG